MENSDIVELCRYPNVAQRRLELENARLRATLEAIHAVIITATAYPETVKYVHELIEEALK